MPELVRTVLGDDAIHHGFLTVKMQQHIVQKIINSKEELDTKKKLQSFLGLVNQVREYIPKLAETLKPLQKKLKKDIEYNYDEKDKKQVQPRK